MKQIPETRDDIKKLLYEQAPLLIKKLDNCDAQGTLTVVQAIIAISDFGGTIPGYTSGA